jgi:O-antigen ligase
MGLLGALLIAAAFHAPVPRGKALRIVLFVIGVAGLVMTKSVGSLAAAGVMFGVFGFWSIATRKETPYRGLLTPARLLLLVIGIAVVAAVVRPGSLPTSKNFNQSTGMNRAVIGAAGLELFRDHPVLGVGWSRGPSQTGSDKIDRQLRSLFGSSLRPDLLPDHNSANGYSSLHNSYIEILAEAGLVGFLCFLALLFAAWRGIRSILRSAGDRRVAAIAWCATVLIVGVLVWWNDNALFGTQPETVLAAVFLGMLAATPLTRQPAETPYLFGRSSATETRERTSL